MILFNYHFTATQGIPSTSPTLKRYSFKCSLWVKPIDFTSDLHPRLRALYTWLWPVFNQIFLMVYPSVWLRRSNVLTGAEWIKTRFGQGRRATLSHTIVIVFALLSVLGFLSYGFIGIGINPQSSLYLHGITGQFTLHPIVITISTCGISDNSLEYCAFSMSI